MREQQDLEAGQSRHRSEICEDRLFTGTRSPPMIQRLYRESFYRRDPTPYHQISEGRVCALGELLRSDNPAHAAYLKAVMIPSGMNVVRMMRVVEPSEVNAWLRITRRKQDFKLEDDTLLRAIAPYLRSVLRSFVALERERTNAVLAGDAIQRLSRLAGPRKTTPCRRSGPGTARNWRVVRPAARTRFTDLADVSEAGHGAFLSCGRFRQRDDVPILSPGTDPKRFPVRSADGPK